MDGATLLTAGGAVVAIVGSNIALIGWLRSDMKSFETKIEGWKEEIQKESKDFHGRLCVIDERSKRQNYEYRNRKNNKGRK
jgi:hypothetical protein